MHDLLKSNPNKEQSLSQVKSSVTLERRLDGSAWTGEKRWRAPSSNPFYKRLDVNHTVLWLTSTAVGKELQSEK